MRKIAALLTRRLRKLAGTLIRPRTYLGGAAEASNKVANVLGRHGGLFYVRLEYPTSAAPGARYGHGRPPHAVLAKMVSELDERYRARLETILRYRDDLLVIDRLPATDNEPFWLTQWLLGLDCASLYTFVRERAPRRYVEIGSGNSTEFVARAIRDGALSTRMTSIDPSPRVGIDQLCDEAVRAPLETADLSLFSTLDASDIVFFDGTHRVFMNSDATTFFLDVVPILAPGVLVGVHDVFLPEDYPDDWHRRFYSEQYLLAAYLLAGGGTIEPELPCYYVSGHPRLSEVLAPLWTDERLRGIDRRGLTFWFTKTS
jgi:predicted O-methyltransferase YrrM